jgi:creatinine amidohydrolase
MLNELLADWEDHGISEFIVVAAHRSEPHMDALVLALASASTTTVFDLYRIDIGDLVSSADGPEHAGEIETSLLLHLDPDRVTAAHAVDSPPDRAAIRRYAADRSPTPPKDRRGVIGYPSRATAHTGEAVFRRWVETLVEAIRR